MSGPTVLVRPAESTLVLRADRQTLVLRSGGSPTIVLSRAGPQGAPGTVTQYVHTQSSPSASWVVNHNLGYRPAAVEVLSTGGMQVEAAVTHVSVNQLQVDFVSPTIGSVIVM